MEDSAVGEWVYIRCGEGGDSTLMIMSDDVTLDEVVI